MPTITLDFPDEATKTQYERWWASIGKQSCHHYLERTAEPGPDDQRYIHAEAQGDPDTWVFWWDAIPF